MSKLFKDGKAYTPPPKAPKRIRVEESVIEQNIALLLQKQNLIEGNIVDDFLDVEIRDRKVLERIKNLENLNQHELLMRLAKTELHLESVLFLYDETYKQKQFLEAAYLKSGEKRLIHAASRTSGKAKVQNKYAHIKETVRQILAEMEEKDFKLLLRKIRAKYSPEVVSDGAIRSYFKEITGLESTK
jgi:hypothetical protein